MIQEEKQLLLKDLSARSYYWPKVTPKYGDKAYIYGIKNTNEGLFIIQEIEEGHDYDIVESIDEFKVYLRPMSSMTEEEDEEWRCYKSSIAESSDELLGKKIDELHDWFYRKHIDFRGLIPMGLALEAPEDMYTKNDKNLDS